MKKSKVSIGPMSKELIDVAIQYAEESSTILTLIPSRRQVDYRGGYVGYTTKSLSEYCRGQTKNILLQRDHGGPLQGQEEDVGFDSFYWDSKYFDSIHIDPFRLKSFKSAVEATGKFIDFCKRVNPGVRFEVGTEESIFPYQPYELGILLDHLRRKLSKDQWESIETCCIQSGTALQGGDNTGIYSGDRLQGMVGICRAYCKASKEHNGDYLSKELVREKFLLGLDRINIAPELGQLQTEIYLSRFKEDQFDEFFKICLESGRWKKWVGKDFSPFEDDAARKKIILLSGHYCFQLDCFQDLKRRAGDIREELKMKVWSRLSDFNQ